MKNNAVCKLRLFYLLLLVFFLFSSAAFGATKIVDASGGGNFISIQRAIDDPDTVDGDTIIVRDGSYIENVIVNKQLTIQSENGYGSTTVIGEYQDRHKLLK